LGSQAPVPVLVTNAAAGELGSLLAAFDMLLNVEQTDAILARALELARSRVGLARVGLFLLDERAERMLGTWGSDLQGEVVDEHHVMFDWSEGAEHVFRRAESEGKPFTVFDNCPIVEQHRDSTKVVGRGWLACTPIRSARHRIGMMFNDAGLSGAPVDDAKQARAAILCALLGSVIEVARAEPEPASARRASTHHPIVRKSIALLAGDPALVGKEIAAALGISLSQLGRSFKSELGISLVEYRNRLRLERFQVLIDAGENNLPELARASGFGSYAQFHRVFRAVYGSAPRDYLRARA
jgi:AraC-like DNA-binding protein